MKSLTKKIITILQLISSIILVTGCTFVQFVNSANSIRKISDHFYYMEFTGDYQLEKFLENGGMESNEQLADGIESLLKGKKIKKHNRNIVPLDTGCASISASSPDGKKFFGRNYDWDNLCAGMIIKSNPKNGYKSISTVQLDFLGFSNNFKPESFGNKYMSVAALFVPLDGMNEKGLCISDLMAGDNEETHQTGKDSSVTTTLAIRCILDMCADVPEAIDFLEKHNMNSVIGKAHHFAISDAEGRMVVVEYHNNEMIVTEANAVTNHYIGFEKPVDSYEERDNAGNSIYRLSVLNDCLESKKNILSEQDVKDVLFKIRASLRASKTWWRAVFNQTDLSVTYSLEEDYSEESEFKVYL